MKTTLKVMFRPSTVEGHPGSIAYRLTHNRITRLVTTDYKVYPEEWDEARASVRTVCQERMPTVQAISQRIRWDVDRLNNIIKGFDNRESGYSVEDVVNEFQRIVRENTLFNFMEAYILRLKQLNKTGTAKNYQSTLDSFKHFRDGEDILIESIDHILIEDYQAHLEASGLVPNSISFYMRILRATYNRAVRQGLTQDHKPFRTVSTGMEKTRKRAISFDEIKRIQDCDLSLHPELAFARDIFMFLFLCRGMSFIDAAFLKKSDIRNGVITYRRHKTNQPLSIKVVKRIQTIINRYAISGSPYVFPIIINPCVDERKQYESALHRINHELKTIGEKLHISIGLTTYVSRHSWATIAKSKNIPVNVISDALGHDSIQTTQVYLASIDSSAIDRANDIVIKDL